MEIIISNSSDKPIYEQIAMQIKSLIMNGTLSAGEALPSMRALAKDLHISVITVQRAYEDLTRDGFIETVSGKGSFVASPNKEFIQEEQLRIAEELLEKVAIIGRTHGINQNQPFGLTVRHIAKLDKEAAEKAFAQFINSNALNTKQIEFIKTVINYVSVNGYMESPKRILEAPFDKPYGVTQLFSQKELTDVVKVIRDIRERAEKYE